MSTYENAGSVATTTGARIPVADLAAAAPQSQSVEVTLAEPDYDVTTELDLEHVSIAYVSVTLLAADSDGDSWGNGEGELHVATLASTSRDGEAWLGGSPALDFSTYVGEGEPAGELFSYVALAARYFRVELKLANYVDGVGEVVYPGANSPSATLRIDVEYL